MIYRIYTHPDRVLVAVCSSLEQIDAMLEGQTYLGRIIFRNVFGIYREQGSFGVPIAEIEPCALDTWLTSFLDVRELV